MSFADYLKINAYQVEKELDKILNRLLNETKRIDPKLITLIKEFVKSCQGGKRIRGVLVNLGYEIAQGKKTNQILKVGAALEIMHTAILAHDDIIDESPKRRDQASLYVRVGEYQAITLADLGFFLAIKILSEIGNSKMLQVFSQTMVNTAIGQIMDINGGDKKIIAKFKTAQYTISNPLVLGAIIAGADNRLIKMLEEFGENLGIAYQIKDDILDKEADDHARKQLIEYTARAEKIIPQLTSRNVKIRQLLKDLCFYLLERSK